MNLTCAWRWFYEWWNLFSFTVYYDVPAIINLVDIVNLGAYDFETPERNPKEADYATPLHPPQNRNPLLNAEAVVNYWLEPA